MTRATRILAAVLLFAAVLGLTAPPDARAQFNRNPEPQQQQIVSIPGGGTELFRALLDKEGVQPVTQRDLNTNNVGSVDELIVVVIGQPFVIRDDPLRWVRVTVASNGAALIASDTQFQVHTGNLPNIRGDNWVAQFNDETVFADWNDCHRQQQDCPYVVPVSPDEHLRDGQKPGPVWGVFRGLTKLATNIPTHLELRVGFQDEYQYPLARLPKSSRRGGGWGFNPPPLFAIGGDGEPQRWNGRPGYAFLAVADSSVFINQMIMEPGTDNLEFTLRTIEYLQGPGKHRKRCLFFENGRVVEKFDGLRGALAKPKPKVPPEAMPNLPKLLDRNQDKLVDLGNKLADQLQTSEKFQNPLGPPGSARAKRNYGEILDRLLPLAAVILVVFLLVRTLRSRAPMDVPPPPNTGAGAASTGPPGVFDRRQKELVRRNNLYEPVRNLMREFFDAVGAPPNPGPRLPPLEISDEVRKPESLRQAIRDMWRIAYGPPQPISTQRWFELEPYFDRLRKAHADGKWRFVPDYE